MSGPGAVLDDEIHRRALGLPLEALSEVAVEESIRRLVREQGPLLDGAAEAALVARVAARLRGLGPLESLLGLEGVTDIMINGPGQIWVERFGELATAGASIGIDELAHLVERIVAPLGRRLDRTSPLVDGRLADGSRVHVAVAPVAVAGPYVTVRRFEVVRTDLEASCGADVAALLRWAVRSGANILVSGGTSSGKTTLLDSLSTHIPDRERIVVVEDAAELQLDQANVARLETRPPSVDGPPAVTIRDLVRHALRMRPDRIIVGEVRGVEAVDMLQAMNTGHEGSLSTVHANSAVDALSRLEAMILLGAGSMPDHVVRRLIVGAVDLVIQVARTQSGERRVVAVAEPVGPDLQVRLLATETGGLVAQPTRAPRRPGVESAPVAS